MYGILFTVVDRFVTLVDNEPILVEVEVDSDATLLFVVLNPVDVDVDSDATLLFVVLNPVDVDVDSDAT
ncbi:hypothetical protein, partial [Burkholderia ubonensis]|uniref:hypothetical protein n=1 Tax=Burkholderia ubonensis TaxID=101571 RepID=UPI0022B76C29